MTAGAKNSFGATLKLADTGGSVAAVAELTSISPPAMSRDTIDVTSHDGASDAMEFIGSGVYDEGEIGISGHWVLGSTADDLFRDAITGNALQDYELIAKAATGTETQAGKCWITNYEPGELTVDGKQEFSATMKITGATTQAATA